MCHRLLSYYVPRRYQRHFLLLLVSLTLVLTYHVQKALFRPRLERMVFYELEEIGERDPNVTCIFPLVHPFDPSILSYVRLANPVKCNNWFKVFLMVDDDGFLRWNETALEEGGYSSNGTGLYCSYREIWRPEGDNFKVKYGEKVEFKGGRAKLGSDFVYVECSNWMGMPVVKDFLAKVQKIQGIRKYKGDELDVLVIGLDSVSKLNFMRQLPKAYKLLTKELEATVLIGFNKVGPNTFPNVVPMLTGRPLIPEPQEKFKEWPFIWKDFANAGAVTMYSEDRPNINMFNFHHEGIDEQPTHHYMHTYWLAAENSIVKKQSSRFCLGPKPAHSIYFSYLKSFLRSYSEEPKFLFSLLNEPTHNFINTVGVIDDVLTDFLNSSYHEGLFNRSAVLILGDHGNRLDFIRLTEVGKIEDSMPMVTIMLPKWVNATWRKSLKLNSNRLTSTYDLYATFVDILHTLGGKPGTPGNTDKRIWDHFTQPARGLSLFSEIPPNRNCDEAGIPDWYCVCSQEEENLPVDDPFVINSTNSAISFINDLLKNFTLCSHLYLDSVSRAVKNKLKDIIHITFQVRPSNALFEATLSAQQGLFQVDNLQRINPYGRQADCLGKEVLSKNSLYKATCYCKSIFSI